MGAGYGWRGLLILGVLPALVCFWIRAYVKEPEVWAENQKIQAATKKHVTLPLFAIWFAVAAVMRRFNRPLLAWMAGMAHDHVVLFGDSATRSPDAALVVYLITDFIRSFPEEALGPYLLARQLAWRDPRLALTQIDRACGQRKLGQIRKLARVRFRLLEVDQAQSGHLNELTHHRHARRISHQERGIGIAVAQCGRGIFAAKRQRLLDIEIQAVGLEQVGHEHARTAAVRADGQTHTLQLRQLAHRCGAAEYFISRTGADWEAWRLTVRQP